MSTALTKISDYDEFRERVAEVKGVCNFIPDVSTDEGYEKSKRVALDVGKVLTALEKKRKEKKADSIAEGKLIDSEAKSIAAELEAFQVPHKEAYKELDTLKKQQIQDRKDKLQARVDDIRNLPEMMADMDSGSVKAAMEQTAANECLDFFEFTEQALKARNASKNELSKMFSEKLKAEKDAAELESLRKKQAEQDQKDREQAIAKAASEKAEAEAAQAKASEQAAIEQAAEAVKQREAAELRAKQDAEDAKACRKASEKQAKLEADAAEGRRIEAEAKAVSDAAAAKIEADQAAIKAAEQAKQAQIQAQKDAEAAEQAAIESREANNKHVGAIRKAAKESLMAVGLDEAMAKKVVLAIHAEKISNVTIKY
jgi:hypothetical protein